MGRSNKASRRVGSRRAFLDLCGPSTMTSSSFLRLFPDTPALSPEGGMLRDASVSMDERLRMSIYGKKIGGSSWEKVGRNSKKLNGLNLSIPARDDGPQDFRGPTWLGQLIMMSHRSFSVVTGRVVTPCARCPDQW